MISDLRVIDEPLAKSICRTCGVVHRRAILPAGLFTTGYSLYAHSPGAPREAKRQDGYASWIAGQLATPPATVLDVGCGNGSLLLALERLWPQAVTRGIDPSPQSIQFARAAGIDARARALGEPSNEQTEPANLVVSVNVIEHTRAPGSFVRDAAKLTVANGEHRYLSKRTNAMERTAHRQSSLVSGSDSSLHIVRERGTDRPFRFNVTGGARLVPPDSRRPRWCWQALPECECRSDDGTCGGQGPLPEGVA